MGTHFTGVAGLVDRLQKFGLQEERKMTLGEVQQQLKTIRDDSRLVSAFPTSSRAFGCFLVDSMALKDDLVGMAKLTHPKAKAVLSRAYRAALNEFWTEIEGVKEKLSGEKEDMGAYEELIRAIKKMRPNNMEQQNQLAMAQGIFNELYGSEKKSGVAKELGSLVDRIARSIEYL